MTTQTIEVEGLPEGYKVNSITVNAKENVSQCFNTVQATIHLKKIQPRRIVLDQIPMSEVKETDIPLTNDEHKLSLSVDECKEALTYAQPLAVARKMIEFIKDK